MTRSSSAPRRVRVSSAPRLTVRPLLAAAALAATPLVASAVDWQGPGPDWLDPTNWAPAVVPNAGDVANFPGISAAPTVNLDGQTSVRGVSIDNSAGYVFSGTGAVTIGALGVHLTGGGGATTFAPAVNINGAQTWQIEAPATLSLVSPNTSEHFVTVPFRGISPLTLDGGGTLDLQFGENDFVGGFVVNNGTLTATNFADGFSRALRSNRVTLGANGTLAAQPATVGSLDVGEVAGSGTLDTGLGGGLFIHALGDATFSGTLKIGNASQGITVRGIGAQTFTGDTSAAKGPPAVTEGASLILAGNAAFLDPVNTSYFARGGQMVLDNSTVNLPNRLNPGGNLDGRGSTDNTVRLIGNAAEGSTQTFNNLLLNTGTLKLRIDHRSGSSAGTAIIFNGGLNRIGTNATVDFLASGGVLGGTIGSGTNAPRFVFNGTGPGTNSVQLLNGVIASGTNAAASVGFATVNNASDFASYDATRGVIPAATTPFPAASDPTANALITTSTTANNAGGAFALNTLKIQPSAPGQSLDITSVGGLSTGAIMLVGPNSFTISSSGLGALSSPSGNTRYYYVSDPNATLDISANTAAPATTPGPITKAGPGTLTLSGINTYALATGTTAFNINILDGVLRASNVALPELRTVLRFRGGVFELVGGGVINRQVNNTNVGTNGGAVTWFGGSADSGSGGFSAAGGSAVVNLDNPLLADTYQWGVSANFLSAGYSLVFGSKSADSVVEWQDNINLSGTTNLAGVDRFYNLREIRVVDNTASNGDRAVFSGALTSNAINLGGQNADWIKTGDGTLELTNANNNYLGSTIVAGGNLVVTGNITNSPNYLLKGGQTTVNGAIKSGANFVLSGGSATFSSARVSLGAVSATAGTLALTTSATSNAKVLTVKSLDLSASGKVNLANNGMIVDYDPGASPIADLRAALKSGYNGGAWNGATGIVSSAAAARAGTGIGYREASSVDNPGQVFPGAPITIDGTAVLLKYTLFGDATLDGTVDFNDLVALAQNYNVVDGKRIWADGDSTYDGNVDFNDLVVLAQNYNTALAPAAPIPGASAAFESDLAAAFAAVPEPSACAIIAACGLAGLKRRRRNEH